MSNSISKKLKVKESDVLLTVDAPSNFKAAIGALPAGVKILSKGEKYSQLHWFVTNKEQLEKELNKMLRLLKQDVLLWIYYPKGTSKIQTDLTRDKGWDELLKHNELHWINLVSFDETWSAFACRFKTEKDVKRSSTPKKRPIFDYIDPVKKIVRLPGDFSPVLKKK